MGGSSKIIFCKRKFSSIVIVYTIFIFNIACVSTPTPIIPKARGKGSKVSSRGYHLVFFFQANLKLQARGLCGSSLPHMEDRIP